MAQNGIGQHSVEGEKLELQTRKFTPMPAIRLTGGTRMVSRFKLQVWGRGEITEELATPANWECGSSQRKLGDNVAGETLSGYGGKVSRPKLMQATKGHKGKEILVKDHGVLRVQIPLRQVVTGGVDHLKQLCDAKE